MTQYKGILYSVADRVATITLNRATSLNSLDTQTIDELLDALAATKDDDVHCVILTGSGRGFCAGADLSSYLGDKLKEARPGDIDLGPPMLDYYNALAAALFELEVPLITAINGLAAGGGLSVALTGDIVIAAKSSAFVLGFSKIGLMPDMGATWLLPRLLGPVRAMGLALLPDAGDARNGAAISAARAAEWGLIWDVVSDEQLIDFAQSLARMIAKQPRQAIVSTKCALKKSLGNDFRQQLLLEMELQRDLGRTQGFHDGVSAFLAK